MIPRNEAMQILQKYGRNAGWTRHCEAVAGFSSIACAALEGYYEIDSKFLWSAALLHDIGRSQTHDPILHGVAGYHLLTGLGHPEEAFVCASHVLFGLRADEAVQFGLPARDFRPRSVEERLVPLIDFLVEFDKPTTLTQRFSSLRERTRSDRYFWGKLALAQKRAEEMLAEIDRKIGRSFEELMLSENSADAPLIR